MSMIGCFSVLILLCQQVTHNKQFVKETCLIIVTDINMTSKRTFLQNVTELLTSTTKKWDFTGIKQLFFGCYSVTTITMDNF